MRPGLAFVGLFVLLLALYRALSGLLHPMAIFGIQAGLVLLLTLLLSRRRRHR